MKKEISCTFPFPRNLRIFILWSKIYLKRTGQNHCINQHVSIYMKGQSESPQIYIIRSHPWPNNFAQKKLPFPRFFLCEIGTSIYEVNSASGPDSLNKFSRRAEGEYRLPLNYGVLFADHSDLEGAANSQLMSAESNGHFWDPLDLQKDDIEKEISCTFQFLRNWPVILCSDFIK